MYCGSYGVSLAPRRAHLFSDGYKSIGPKFASFERISIRGENLIPTQARSWVRIFLAIGIALPTHFTSAATKSVTRDDRSPLEFSVPLKEDIYRTETYQAYYTEEVPYQHEEFYYEQVPYQELERYTDYEDYWQRETVCRNETRWDDLCENKRRCEPRFERRCERKRVCQVAMPGLLQAALLLLQPDEALADRNGRGGRGGGNEDEDRRRRDNEDRQRHERERNERERRDREDRDRREREDRGRREREERCNREVCENVKVGENCRDEHVCRKVPRHEKVCREENVRKSRPVEKTRWVTKYRDERRTRWVTKYRTEQRCCVTKERQVFDHSIRANITLQFPPQATLEKGEKESFSVSLNEVVGRPNVTVQPKGTIYAYQPKIQAISAEDYVVQMDVVPSYAPGDLGDMSLTDVTLASIGPKLRLTWMDKGVVKKVRTDYVIRLIDPSSGVELAHLDALEQKQVNAVFDFGLNLPIGTPVLIRLEVRRNGIVLAQPIYFTAERALMVTPDLAYDPAPYMDKSQVGKFSLGGRGPDLVLYFRDLTQDIPQVSTQYQYRLSLGGKVLSEKVFSRGDLNVQSDGRIPLPAADAFGLSEGDLKLLSKGKILTVDGRVIRHGMRFPGGSYTIPKKVNLTIP